MNYFITDGTDFIGRVLVDKLLQCSGTVYVLIRDGSQQRWEDLCRRNPQAKDRLMQRN